MLDWLTKLRCSKASAPATAWRGTTTGSRLVDIQWADVRPEKGLYYRLVPGAVDAAARRRGGGAAATTTARRHPGLVPGHAASARFGAEVVVGASWDSVVFDVPGHASLQRVPILEPERGTRAQVGALLEESGDASALLRGWLTPD